MKEQPPDKLIEVYPDVLLLELSGKVNNGTGEQLVGVLREGINKANAPVVVLNVTDGLNIDTETAQCFNDIITTTRELDTQLILSIAHSSTSQQLTVAGVDLSGIKVHSTLATGLWAALDILEPETTSPDS